MRKQMHYATLSFLLFHATFLFGENHVDQYINSYKDIAVREMMRSGIPASITLAQGIHESTWGRGELALKSNNHFGIKCKSYWTGSTYYHEDDDYDANGNLLKSCFRAYENPEKSYIDHTDFLMTTDHYQELFTYSSTDYIRWAKGLKKCGYATDKEYANKLIQTIEKYQLNRFDFPIDQPLAASAPSYNIPQHDIASLVISSEKEEYVQYNEWNVPEAIVIPEDYQRRVDDSEIQTFKTETSVKFESEFPAAIALNNEQNLRNTPPPNQNKYNTEPQRDEMVHVANNRKESIIPVAFENTNSTYQLSRKPRQTNPGIR